MELNAYETTGFLAILLILGSQRLRGSRPGDGSNRSGFESSAGSFLASAASAEICSGFLVILGTRSGPGAGFLDLVL